MRPELSNPVPDATLAGTILLAYGLDRLLPGPELIPYPFSLAGWIAVAAGLVLSVSTHSLLRSYHTSTDPAGVPSALLTTGFYARSRNPLYLGYVITTAGAAVILGSLAAFIAPVLCYSILRVVIIPVEEKNLLALFGQRYEEYRRSVRRWI